MAQVRIIDADYDAHETLPVSSASVGFTAGTMESHRNAARVTVEGADVRFWLDGTAPTASEGHELGPGDVLKLGSQHELQNVRFIRKNSVDATLRCSFGS